jgi:hypothetical protein
MGSKSGIQIAANSHSYFANSCGNFYGKMHFFANTNEALFLNRGKMTLNPKLISRIKHLCLQVLRPKELNCCLKAHLYF